VSLLYSVKEKTKVETYVLEDVNVKCKIYYCRQYNRDEELLRLIERHSEACHVISYINIIFTVNL
jgi:hypothetical protein